MQPFDIILGCVAAALVMLYVVGALFGWTN